MGRTAWICGSLPERSRQSHLGPYLVGRGQPGGAIQPWSHTWEILHPFLGRICCSLESAFEGPLGSCTIQPPVDTALGVTQDWPQGLGLCLYLAGGRKVHFSEDEMGGKEDADGARLQEASSAPRVSSHWALLTPASAVCPAGLAVSCPGTAELGSEPWSPHSVGMPQGHQERWTCPGVHMSFPGPPGNNA